MASGRSPVRSSAPLRFRRGKDEWRPSYPVRYAPLLAWPPQPQAALKWLLGYPGYLWPWNTLYLLVTLATWYWLQPPPADCATLAPGWVGLVFLRNLGLLWLTAGGWHLLLYTLKVQGTRRKYDPRWPRTDDPKFLFRSQLRDNIFWSCASGCTVWSAYEVLYFWSAANGRVPLADWTAHPVWCVAWLCLIPLWREFHFYWIHRAIHWPPLYRRIHYLHHKNISPGPWSGLAMHPLEHVLYFSVVLIHWVVPSHPIHFLFNSQHTALTPAAGHHGFEGPLLDGRLPTGSYFHYLHHRYFVCNFGESTLPLDRWFGTFHDGMPNDRSGSATPPAAEDS